MTNCNYTEFSPKRLYNEISGFDANLVPWLREHTFKMLEGLLQSGT